MKSPFYPADILIPRADITKWAVIACDQFTSSGEYWKRVKKNVGGERSSLDLILPEIYLDDAENAIPKIRAKMAEYLENGVFTEYKNAVILVERTLPSGKIRRGVVGMIDLDEYPDGGVRPTEKTVPERVPPRVKIRKGAPIELPHVLLFTDSETAIPAVSQGRVLYDANLMEGGGHVKGTLLTEDEKDGLIGAITSVDSSFCLAVGDGNHSLAAAKASGSKYALVEVVSVRDESIVFEPIYRVVKNVDVNDFIPNIKSDGDKEITLYYGGKTRQIMGSGLPVSAVDKLIEEYKASHPEISVDYIHGKDELIKLSNEQGYIGFVFDGIKKEELFPYIEKHGCLPKKAFSMGTAYEKRYYIEAMKIINA